MWISERVHHSVLCCPLIAEYTPGALSAWTARRGNVDIDAAPAMAVEAVA